jgi:hypothetical protein
MGRGIAVQGDRVRRPTFVPDRFPEERFGCGYIPSAAEPEIDGLTSLVHRSVEIHPLAAYLDVGLIDSPRATSGPAKAIPPVDELWGVPPDPPHDGRVGKMQSAFHHHLDQITEAGLVAQVPAHAQDDHLAVKVPPCKQLFDAAPLAHRWSSTLRKTNVPD